MAKKTESDPISGTLLAPAPSPELIGWCRAEGAPPAALRAERLAEQEARAAAEGRRRVMPREMLEARAAAVLGLVVAGVDAHARAAGLVLDFVDPWTAESVHVRTPATSGRVRCWRDDAALRVIVGSPSRSIEWGIDLDLDAFQPEEAAREILREWFTHANAAAAALHLEASYVNR